MVRRHLEPTIGRATVSMLALLAALLVASVCRAQQRTLLLVHRTPEAADCPDAAALAQAVHAIVGREVIGTSPDPSATWIEVTMTRLKQGYFANVHTFGTNVGRRDISDSGADCRGLGEAVAVSLALMWSSDGVESTAEAPPSADPSEPSPANPPPPAPPSPPAVPKQRPRQPPPSSEGTSSVSVGVEALVGVAIEVLEHPVPSAELGGRLEIGEHAGFGLGAGALGIDRVESEQGVVELSLGYAYLAGCLGITRESPRVAFCFRPMLGLLRGEGRDFERSHSESVLYAALSAAAELRGRVLGSATYVARLTGVAPLTRNGFSIADASAVEAVFVPPAVGLMASIGVGWGSTP